MILSPRETQARGRIALGSIQSPLAGIRSPFPNGRSGGLGVVEQLFANGEKGAWWDFTDLATMASDLVGPVPASINSAVAGVSDKSGNGEHLIQATAAARPILRDDATRGIGLEFDGSDDVLRCAGFDMGGSDQVSVFMLASTTKANVQESWFALGNPATHDGSFEHFRGFGSNRFDSRGTTRVTGPGTDTTVANQMFVFAASAEISPPSIVTNFNGTASAPTTSSQGTGAYIATDFALGGRAIGGLIPAGIFVKELIVRNAATTGDLFDQIMAYLAAKGGVTLP